MALLYSRTSKVQSFHQGYPRKAVEEVRADPPSPRLHSLVLMKHLLLCHKLPLKTPARPGILSLAPHRHCSAQLTPPVLAGSAPCQDTNHPKGGYYLPGVRCWVSCEPRLCGDGSGEEETALGTKLGPEEHRKAASRDDPLAAGMLHRGVQHTPGEGGCTGKKESERR